VRSAVSEGSAAELGWLQRVHNGLHESDEQLKERGSIRCPLEPRSHRSGNRLLGRQLVRVAFRSRLVLLGHAVELQDPVHMNLRQTARDRSVVGIVAPFEFVLAVTQFAFDLDVGSFLQLAGKFDELAPDVAAMPLGT
jgi:hypothetical protein